jgi:hypothetical protein
MNDQHRATVRVTPALPIHPVAVTDIEQTLVIDRGLTERFSSHKL